MLSIAFGLRAGLALSLLMLGLFVSFPAHSATPQAEARFQAGRQADSRRDYATARHEFGQACDASHMRACTGLANLVIAGLGGPTDLPRARALFAKACVVNIAWSAVSDSFACHELAAMTLEGEGGPRQPARAAYLYARGCDIGDGQSCDALAVIMLDGAVLPLNSELMLGAVATRACMTEYLDYCQGLADVGSISEDSLRDFRKALALFEEAHRLPAGTPLDEKKSLLSEACGLGLARACARAAWEWKHGFQNMPVDQGQAVGLYALACLLGDGAGCSEGGDAAQRGVGTPKNLSDAAEYYSMACQLAYPPGCQSLAWMHKRGEITADLPLARKLEQFVCDSGWGCVIYADMLIQGVGGAPDLVRARQVLQVECDDKTVSSNACERLARLSP